MNSTALSRLWRSGVSAAVLTLAAGLTLVDASIAAPPIPFGSDSDETITDQINGNIGLEKVGTGTATMTRANTYTGGTTISAGTLALGVGGSLSSTGSVTIGEAGTFDISPGADQAIGSLAGTGGHVTLGANTLTINGSVPGTFGGNITGSGGIVKNGASTQTFTGANSFTGNLTINAGTVALSGGGSFAPTVGVTLLNAGATFDISNSTLPTVTIGALAGVNGSSLELGSKTLTFGDGTDQTFAGTISGLGSSGHLVKQGTGVERLTGANTYGGGTSLNGGGLILGNSSAIGTGALTVNNAASLDTQGVFTLSNNITLNSTLTLVGSNDLTLSGVVSGAGGLTFNGAGTLNLKGANTYTGLTTINGGTLALSGAANHLADVTLANANTTLDVSGATTPVIGALSGVSLTSVTLGNAPLTLGSANDATFAGSIGGNGGIIKEGTGVQTLSGGNTYGGGTTLNAGTLSISDDSNLGFSSGALTFNGGILQFTGTGIQLLSTARAVTWGANGGGFDITNAGTVFIVHQDLGGTGGLRKLGAGILSLSGNNTYSGATTIEAGVLTRGPGTGLSPNSAFTVATGAFLELNNSDGTIGSLAGAGQVDMGIGTLTAGGDNTSTTFSGVITGSGGFTKTGTGRLDLSGTSTYTGATIVDGGTLSVNGDISSSSGVTVNAAAILGGNGIVGNTSINGGTLAPGNSIGLLTVNGNLSFTATSSYMVEVSPSNADRVNVTGTATLGGATVHVSYAPGSYLAKQYTILTAGNPITDTFNGPVSNNLPSSIRQNLSYDQNNVYLNTQIAFAVPGGLNQNQQRVGNALTNFFNTTDGIPLSFATLTPQGLTQASGELGTGAQQTTFQAMNLFMGLMTDPFSAGRGVAHNGPTAFADDSESVAYAGRVKAKSPRDAFAAFTKAPPAVFAQRWNVWAAGYGGSQTTDGNAVTGSNNTTSAVYGAAAGADYWFSPDTVAGFALAGGGSNFSVANGGSGRSDMFQAGAFVRHNFDATYVTASVAYGWQDVTTDRYVSVAGLDHLRANFNANAYSGRLELGHRFLTPWFGGLGVSPYGAAQITAFELPSYAERAISGASTFALNYGADTVTSSRTELGLRSDKSYALDGAVLTLRGRAAWAHDFDPDRAIAATFQTLPGASFVVNGAALASDSALTTASAEVRWMNGWSVTGTFEGEFSNVTRSYAGKGVVRYNW